MGRSMIGTSVVVAVLFVSIMFAPRAKAQTRHIGQGWWYGEHPDPMTKEGSSFIARAAKGHPDNGSGAGLMIVCQSDVKSLGLAIDWDDFIGLDGFVDVALRVDERASMTFPSWHADQSTSTTFDEDARAVVKEMRQGKAVMQARIIDEDDDTRTLAFDLAGFEEAIGRVLDHCDD